MVITEWSLHVLIQEEAQRECSGNCGQCVQSIGFLKQFGGAHDLGMTTVNSSRSCCNFFDGVPTTRVVSLFQLQTLSVEGIIHDPLLLGVTRSLQSDKLFQFVRYTTLAIAICRYAHLHEWQQSEAMIWCGNIVPTAITVLLCCATTTVLLLLELLKLKEN
jgi:hypothetical protein